MIIGAFAGGIVSTIIRGPSELRELTSDVISSVAVGAAVGAIFASTARFYSSRLGHLLAALAGCLPLGFMCMRTHDNLFDDMGMDCAIPRLPWGSYGWLTMFFVLHLFDLYWLCPDLPSVLEAVNNPISQLMQLSVFILFFIYLFATVAFYLFPDSFIIEGVAECDSLARCFAIFLHNGLIAGGGIGEWLTFEGDQGPVFAKTGEEFLGEDIGWWSYTGRIVFDILFFISVVILLLNIVFGVIIDQFASIRDRKQEEKRVRSTRCFVCELEKTEFGPHYSTHCANEHNMWHYLYLLIYLEEKEPNEYSGAESYIASFSSSMSVAWLPLHRAKFLYTAASTGATGIAGTSSRGGGSADSAEEAAGAGRVISA
jgi:hypothetical protein